MASCFVLGILRSITTQIRSLSSDSNSSVILPTAVWDELKRLKNAINQINSMNIEDAEERSSDRHVIFWLRELQDVAYSVKDVVDVCEYEVLLAESKRMERVGGGGWKPNSTGVSASPLGSDILVASLNKVCTGFEGLIKKPPLQFVQKLRQSESATTGMGGRIWIPSNTSVLDEPGFFGRDREKETIINLLLSEDGNTGSVSIISIRGPKGVGKTTLAQLVYQNTSMSSNFDLRGWVNVPRNFCITTITRSILQSFRKKTCTLKDLTRLQKELVRELMGKKFLIVLDGMYHEDSSLWELFLAPFLYAQSGKIIIITDNSSMAKIVQSTHLVNLTSLSFEDSWSMFKKIAFGSLDAKGLMLTNLLKVGEKIVRNCRGFPLFIKAVASAFKLENIEKWVDIFEWVAIAFKLENIEKWWVDNLETDRWDFFSDMNPILEKCYKCMSVMLKQCFLFLAMYPRGHVFCKDNLIRLWMYVGIFKEEGKESLDIGSLVFDELLQRAMLQPTHKDCGSDDGFLVHDLVHDMARTLAGEDFAVIEHDCLNYVDTDVRYLSIIVPDLNDYVDLQPIEKCRNLRVLQILNQGNTWKYGGVKITIPAELFQKLNYLRALILRDTQLETLPNSIGNLKLLRSLDLMNTCIERLPESIGHLYNLQVLELTNSPLKELPEGIINLSRLQVLNFQTNFGLCIPRGIRCLISLKILSRFDVKKGNWHCALSDFNYLVNLKGGIVIGGLSNLTSIEEAKQAHLRNIRNLQALTLDWSSEPFIPCSHSAQIGSTLTQDSSFDEKVLQVLRPHTNLRELHIIKYGGSRFPRWLGDQSFTRLGTISLVGGEDKCEVLPAMGQLPYLRKLSIRSMSNIRFIGSEFCSSDVTVKGFQSLETLEFSDMLIWSEWTGVEDGEFPSLRTLKLVDCPQLRMLPEPLSSSLTELVIHECAMLTRLPPLPSLGSLCIHGNVSDSRFFMLYQPLLKTLRVHRSRNKVLDLHSAKLPSLRELIIHGCRNLQSVRGIDVLESLKIFKISACPNLQFSLNAKFPETLARLDISKCQKLQNWKRIHEFKYHAQFHMPAGGDNDEPEHGGTSQINIMSDGAQQHDSGNSIESGPAYKSKELMDEDEFSDQVQTHVSAKGYKGKEPADLGESDTWSGNSD